MKRPLKQAGKGRIRRRKGTIQRSHDYRINAGSRVETRNPVGDMIGIQLLQEIRVKIVARSQQEHTGAICVHHGFIIGHNTSTNFRRHNRIVGLERDMITNPTGGPDVMNMFAPQVTDDRINICWIARKTAGGLECIVRVSLRIGNPLYTVVQGR